METNILFSSFIESEEECNQLLLEASNDTNCSVDELISFLKIFRLSAFKKESIKKQLSTLKEMTSNGISGYIAGQILREALVMNRINSQNALAEYLKNLQIKINYDLLIQLGFKDLNKDWSGAQGIDDQLKHSGIEICTIDSDNYWHLSDDLNIKFEYIHQLQIYFEGKGIKLRFKQPKIA